MIRVLHVIGSLDMGGSQMMVLNLYKKIDKTKIQFDFIVREGKTYSLEQKFTSLGAKIYKLPTLKITNYFTYVEAWKKFFKQHTEYKIIHGHVRSTAAIYLKIAKSFGLKTISHSHSTQNRGYSFIKTILQFPIRYIADYFFACSKDAGKWLFGKKVISKKNFFVIPNAIDTNKFAYNPSIRQIIRKKLNVEHNFVVGHVGRFTKVKNHTFLLKVFAEIYKQNNGSRLLLVGYGELKEKLIQESKKLKIIDAIIFSDTQTSVSEYYQAMDVFVFPSLYEGLGIVLIEAQTSGLPCVISANLPEEIDLQCGLITRVNLNQSINYWVEQVLNSIGKLRKTQQQNTINKGYDISVTTKLLEKFYLQESI